MVYYAAGSVSRWPATSHVQAHASKPPTDVCRPKQQDYRRRAHFLTQQQAVPRRSLLSKRHTVSQRTCNCNFRCPPQHLYSLPPPAFMKLTNYQHYVHISYTEFHPNLSVNVGSKDRRSLTPPVRCVSQCTGFHQKHSSLTGTTGCCKCPKVPLSAFTPTNS